MFSLGPIEILVIAGIAVTSLAGMAALIFLVIKAASNQRPRDHDQ